MTDFGTIFFESKSYEFYVFVDKPQSYAIFNLRFVFIEMGMNFWDEHNSSTFPKHAVWLCIFKRCTIELCLPLMNRKGKKHNRIGMIFKILPSSFAVYEMFTGNWLFIHFLKLILVY